jgi:hypothetical protein
VVCDLVLSSNADLPSVIGFMSMSVEKSLSTTARLGPLF